MQTFITDLDLEKSASNLDNKRLGKQRVEAIQIASCLLIKETRWKNHPAVKMWKGYENFLVTIYLFTILTEWANRGFNNFKCDLYYMNLSTYFSFEDKYIRPVWITKDFIEAHRSNLIRKDPEHYKPLFPNTKEGLPYIWPVK